MSYAMAILSLYAYVTWLSHRELLSYLSISLSLNAYVSWLSHRELLSGGVLESHAGLLLPYPTIYNITMI